MFELVFAMRDIAKNFADIERYFGLLSETIQVKDPEKPLSLTKVKGEIVFNNVYFSYKGGQKNALKGVSLAIRQGQAVALVGRSGSGKTTMVKALMRFYDLDSGKIAIDDIDISRVSKQELRSHMGVVPQEPILFNNTIGYNIKYGKPEATKAELVGASKMANIHDFIMTMPNKYNTNVGERGIRLSGGQKQRVAIARMILANPDIIIFDEATSHLDSESEKLIQDAFWKASKNKTTVIIAHRLSTIMKADKIVVLSKGKIKEVGTHGELLNKDGSLYKYLWNLQTRAR
jgi:ABC-type multidrug transport system fused ATPase/permease subunit